MFFGVPIFAVVYTLVKEAVDRRVAMREAREEYEAAHVQGAEGSPQATEEPVNDDSSEETEAEISETSHAEDTEPQN